MILNNRGQSLVMFILIIPILIGIMVMVIDIGNVIYNKQDIDNINKLVIDYGVSNINSDSVVKDMRELGYLNNKNLDMDIVFRDREIVIDSSYYVVGVFSKIFDTDGYLVRSKYKGYMDSDGKHIIKKVK